MKLLQALRLRTLNEAKVVLLAMLITEKNEATLDEVAAIADLPLGEAAEGAHLLRVLGVNTTKQFDKIVLSKEWCVNESVQQGVGVSVPSQPVEADAGLRTVEGNPGNRQQPGRDRGAGNRHQNSGVPRSSVAGT